MRTTGTSTAPGEPDTLLADGRKLEVRVLSSPQSTAYCRATNPFNGCFISRYACVSGATQCPDPVGDLCASGCVDQDGDGHDVAHPLLCPTGDDCNDNAGPLGASIYPGAPEICDGYDNNCDGLPDEIASGPDMGPAGHAHPPTHATMPDNICPDDPATGDGGCDVRAHGLQLPVRLHLSRGAGDRVLTSRASAARRLPGSRRHRRRGRSAQARIAFTVIASPSRSWETTSKPAASRR